MSTVMKRRWVGTSLVGAGLLVGFACGQALREPEVQAQASPTRALAEQDVYYPGTEDLDPDEMRVIACGTGMPNARPKQAAACFLVELGNGDKFLFDIGTGSAERISALKIPYDYLDKVFVGHLEAHLDRLAFGYRLVIVVVITVLRVKIVGLV